MRRADLFIPLTLVVSLLSVGAVSCSDEDGDDGGTEPPDNSRAAMEEIIASKEFEAWTSEPEPRPAIENSPHKMVRTYFNPLLEDSLSDFDGEHPVGAIAVKELYDDEGLTIIDYFVSLKHADDGEPADNFTWYSQAANNYLVGPGFCATCHTEAGNLDTTRTPLP